MMKKLVFSLSLLFALLPSEIYGALLDYNIYFINGMDNEPITAKTSRDRLHALVLPDVPDGSVQNLYQRNTGSYWTMIERVRQMAIAENSRETFKRYWRCYAELTPDMCNATVPVATDMRQMILDTLGAYSETAYVQNPQLQAMVAAVTNSYNNGRKSLLVAHSQGNFYANQVVNFLQTAAPNVAACTNVVSLASPATYVVKNGPYKTRYDDVVVAAAALYFPGSILPANYAGSATADWSGHKFIESYINPSALRSAIRADIVAQTTTAANSTCPLDCAPFNSTAVYSPNGNYTEERRYIGRGQRTINVRLNVSFSGPYQVDAGVIIRSSLGASSTLLTLQAVYPQQNAGTYRGSFSFDSNIHGEYVWVHTYRSYTSGVSATACIDCGYTLGAASCP